MTYLYWRCAANVNGCRGDWEVMNFNGDLNVETLLGIISALTKFMAAVGYSNPSQLSNKDGDSVMKKVAETFPELREISVESYDSSYSTYIQRVKQKGFKSLDYTPEECPLYSLHHAAMAYWESEPAKSSEIREAIENISETFDSISKTANEPGDFLKRNIANLHEKLRKFLNPDSSESGSDGPPKPGSSRTMNTNLDGSETFGDSTTTSESATTLTTTTERTSPTSTAESATPTPSITTTTATEYSSGGGGTGDRGPLGSVGPTGINGDRGEAGPARPQSPRGDIGDTGEERGHARSTTPSSVPDSRPQLSVSAVQAAGPVAILALGGGGTAAYFLDIGGFGTMVRSVIGSH
ncbi:variant erythrocyte surface antigen-1 family protein [Babesia caballi]|uniref:Variant erythrocyte surface antigen-1 family protein n=1 Tax=Babesia caballi TaxID=5871 RepID=A0AAV4LVW6_BABCB|nr:variant erythrocyte surface antigen-1 family protein [Babesia caballi]